MQEDPRLQLFSLWFDGANFDSRTTDLFNIKLELFDGFDKSGLYSRIPFAILERSYDTESAAPYDMQVYVRILYEEIRRAFEPGA